MFLLVPVGKRTGSFVTSMQFPGSCILFPSSGLGRCSLVSGFGWDTVWWEKNVAGFFAQLGVTGRLRSRSQALADIPGEGGVSPRSASL